uniref:Ubiquitin-like protease family profile domain-containing protein n=1 Tax=viral metagenome TaxID=1070528 RepID=A0A6C0DWR2_9ZZZZ
MARTNTRTRRKRRTNQRVRLPIRSKTHRLNCSPAIKNSVSTESCFTPEILMKIKDNYNKRHHSSAIQENDPKKIWHLLRERLSCEREDCWLKEIGSSALRQQIKSYVFAPTHPPEWNKNPDEWLSNFDIKDVAKQYETSNPEFKLIGPTTIDFDTRLPENGKCVLEDLCTFSLDKFINAKKTKIGMVFNLDKHYQSGSHWVSLFVDIENHFLFYFDSADNDIPPEIWVKNGASKNKKGSQTPLVNRLIEQGKAHDIDFDFYTNEGNQHQKSNTECGMYSIFFITTLLTGKTPFTKGVMSVPSRINLFLKKKIPDKYMLECRKIFFND